MAKAHGKALHPKEVQMRAQLDEALRRGTQEHYRDAVQYDHEYGRRKDDVAFYLQIAEKYAKGPILELGSGSGRLTAPLAKAGHEVVGVDASVDMIHRCRERLEQQGLTATLHRADFRKLAARSPLGSRRFSLVLCPFNTFQHLYEREDVEQFLGGIKARLAPGGLFVFDLMNPDLRWLSRDSTKQWDRTRYKDPRTRAWMYYSTQIVYDSPLQIAFVTIFHEPADGPKKGVRRSQRELLTQRHYFPRELEALLHYNGMEIERRDGDFQGGALEPESEQQVLFCRAPRSKNQPRNPRR